METNPELAEKYKLKSYFEGQSSLDRTPVETLLQDKSDYLSTRPVFHDN